MSPSELATAITAIGALGTAAFGVVDATKAFGGGVSNAGFTFIEQLLTELAPNDDGVPVESAITHAAISQTLKATWLNGASASDQKSTLKSLIKLRLNPKTAEVLARVTGVDPGVLGGVADSINEGQSLTPAQLNVYGRFDLLLSTMIDRAYQRADQRYRNVAKAVACLVAVILAEIAAWAMTGWNLSSGTSFKFVEALIAGLLATPIAPIAKDLATGITTAANAVQSIKGKS